MEQLNYKHLYYFWMVAREGGISRACAKLHLAQPTVSGQLAAFEQAVGAKLFARDGRKLMLTDVGRLVFRYAEEIFTLGQELAAALKGKATDKTWRLTVGVADALPKLVSYGLLEPALQFLEPVQLICQEGKAERLLAEVAAGELDLVLTDVPLAVGGGRALNHLLGECPVSVFASPGLAERYRPGFPHSLENAPLLLPTVNTALRRELEQWFDNTGIRPKICAEIEDSALLKTFGSGGVGLFFAPDLVENKVLKQYQVELVGRLPEVRERFYAVTQRRKFNHPVVAAILNHAKATLQPAKF